MPLLRDIALISQGLARAGHGAGTRSGEWFLRVAESGNISGNVWLPLEELREVGVAWNHRSERHLLRPFDVLVTARAGSVQAALVPPQVSRTVAGVTLLVVRAKEPGFGMGHWFWYYLTSTFGQAEMTKRLVASATMKTLSARGLGEIEIPVPTPGTLEWVAELVEASEEAFAAALRAATLRREVIRDGLVQSLSLKRDELL